MWPCAEAKAEEGASMLAKAAARAKAALLLFTHLRFVSSNTLRDAHKLLQTTVWCKYVSGFLYKKSKNASQNIGGLNCNKQSSFFVQRQQSVQIHRLKLFAGQRLFHRRQFQNCAEHCRHSPVIGKSLIVKD